MQSSFAQRDDSDRSVASSTTAETGAAAATSPTSPAVPCSASYYASAANSTQFAAPSPPSSCSTKRRWPCLLTRTASGSGRPNKMSNIQCPFSMKAKIKKRVRISEHDAFRQSLVDSSEQQQSSCAAAAAASPGAYMTEQEKGDAWWSAQDFFEVKEEVKRQCKDRRQDQHYSDCLTDAYQSACIVAASCGSSDDGWGAVLNESQADQLGGSSASLPAFPDERVARRLTGECAPRGLEVYSSRLHALRRQRHLQESKHAVFLEQARQQSHNVRDADLLACQARRASRWARSFATLLGRADAWAAATATADDDDGAGGMNQPVPPSADGATDNSSPSTLNDEMDESTPCVPPTER